MLSGGTPLDRQGSGGAAYLWILLRYRAREPAHHVFAFHIRRRDAGAVPVVSVVVRGAGKGRGDGANLGRPANSLAAAVGGLAVPTFVDLSSGPAGKRVFYSATGPGEP